MTCLGRSGRGADVTAVIAAAGDCVIQFLSADLAAASDVTAAVEATPQVMPFSIRYFWSLAFSYPMLLALFNNVTVAMHACSKVMPYTIVYVWSLAFTDPICLTLHNDVSPCGPLLR